MTDDSLDSLLSDFWNWRLQQSPEFATMAGSKLYNHILEEFTEARFEADFEACKVFLARAKALGSVVGSEEKEELEFFEAEVETFVEGFPHGGYFFPINYMEGVQVDFQRLTEWAPPSDLKDFENVIARYRLFPAYIKQIVGVMQKAVSKGLTNHACSMKGVVDKCREHLAGEIQDSVFFAPFKAVNELLGDEAGSKVQEEAREAITDGVRLGFSILADFLEKEYVPACRKEVAVTSLPGGQELYKACLRFHTSTSLTAEEIHQRGLEEVKRIEDEMRIIIQELGLKLSLEEFIKQLRNDKQNFYGSAEELLGAFHTIIWDRVDPQLTKIFKAKPKGALEITRTPLADYPAAFYIAGTSDGARPSKLFVNTHKFDSQPKYEMVSLSLHEALPGHHLQGDYIQRDDWPEFRKVMEDRAYSQAPTRFPINTAYVEGWGLYSETLGHDLGLYSDPMDRYGHLSEEIFRACRLVVDTGMHALGWSREQAVQYMMDHTAASKENIVGEVDRYVTWPGQAVGYKIGQMKILELRKRAEQELGEKFDIKEFHEVSFGNLSADTYVVGGVKKYLSQVVLKAAGPLDLLERKVDEHIRRTLSS